jgi:hypothetical protein
VTSKQTAAACLRAVESLLRAPALSPHPGLLHAQIQELTQFHLVDARQASTSAHPHSADVWPHCERKLASHEGPKTGRDFMFATGEIADALVLVAGGKPLPSTSLQVRVQIHRTRPDPQSEAAQERRAKRIEKERVRRVKARGWYDNPFSTQNRLVSAWIDNFAPIVVEPYRVKRWPKVIAIDSLPLRKRSLFELKRVNGTTKPKMTSPLSRPTSNAIAERMLWPMLPDCATRLD